MSGSQGIVVKCTTPIFFSTVDWGFSDIKISINARNIVRFDTVTLPLDTRIEAKCIQLFRERLSNESIKAYATIPKGIMG